MMYPLSIILDEKSERVLLIALCILLFIWLVAWVSMWLAKRQDGARLAKIWKAFRIAIKHDRVEDIDKYGRDLIYNSYVSEQQLKKARKLVNARLEKHPELGELSLLMFNRCNGQ